MFTTNNETMVMASQSHQETGIGTALSQLLRGMALMAAANSPVSRNEPAARVMQSTADKTRPVSIAMQADHNRLIRIIIIIGQMSDGGHDIQRFSSLIKANSISEALTSRLVIDKYLSPPSIVFSMILVGPSFCSLTTSLIDPIDNRVLS